jgi:hypothetical protein
MADVEPEQPQDGFEIEITDIDALESAGSSSKPWNPLLFPRFSPRQHRLQLTITSAIVVLAVLLILGSTAPVRELVGRALVLPTPTTVPASGPEADLFYIQANPPWGHLSIDGHEVAHLPRINVDPPLRFPQGQHVLVWHADPFPPQSCTLSVPARYRTDTCTAYGSIITFTASLNRLPALQRALLIQTVQMVLDSTQSSETIQPGELYAFAPAIAGSQNNPCRITPQSVLCFATAKQPLRATLRFQLDTDTSPGAPCSISQACILNGRDCRLFCDGPGGTIPPPVINSEWNVLAVVRSLWEYVTLDGQIIAHDQADTFIAEMANDHFVPLRITWNNPGWQVLPLFPSSQAPFSDTVCDSAIGDAQALAGAFVINNLPVQVQKRSLSGANPATGCVLVITPERVPGGRLPSTATKPLTAFCLHRFGVLLAANDVAHRQWPYLPLADSYEQGLAYKLATEI